MTGDRGWGMPEKNSIYQCTEAQHGTVCAVSNGLFSPIFMVKMTGGGGSEESRNQVKEEGLRSHVRKRGDSEGYD